MSGSRQEEGVWNSGQSIEIETPMVVRADLHVHTNVSRDGIMSPTELEAVAIRRGLTCLAITDHNSISGAKQMLAESSLQIIVGEEIRSTAGEITGLFLEEMIPSDLTPLEVVRRIKEQGGLVYVPHPFDRLRGSVLRASALEQILPMVDIVEAYNSRNVLPQDNTRALMFASEHGLLVAGGSDAHIPYEVGRTVVEMPAFRGPDEFLSSLRVANIIGRRSPSPVHLVTTWAKLWRRLRR